MGFDDLRPLSIGQKRPMPVYANAQTFDIVRRAFSYAFDGKPTVSSVPSVLLKEINGPFESRLLHKRMCDSQCGPMVSAFGSEVPEAVFQFMN